MDSNIIVKEYLSVFQPNLYLLLRIVRVITVHKEKNPQKRFEYNHNVQLIEFWWQNVRNVNFKPLLMVFIPSDPLHYII